MVFKKGCKLCNVRFLRKGKGMAVCPKCYKKICRGRRRNRSRIRMLYNIVDYEYDLLIESCVICSRTDFIVIHHVVPRKLGGEDSFENYLGLCQTCHLLIHMRGISLSRLLWCRNKTIQGVQNKLKDKKFLLENNPES